MLRVIFAPAVAKCTHDRTVSHHMLIHFLHMLDPMSKKSMVTLAGTSRKLLVLYRPVGALPTRVLACDMHAWRSSVLWADMARADLTQLHLSLGLRVLGGCRILDDLRCVRLRFPQTVHLLKLKLCPRYGASVSCFACDNLSYK